jgi:hypothetical protein
MQCRRRIYGGKNLLKKFCIILVGLLLISTFILTGCSGGNKSGVLTTKVGDVNVTVTTDNSAFSDIPVYSKAKATTGDYSALTNGMSSTVNGVTTKWKYYEIALSDVDAAQKFYKTAMADNGWQAFDMNIPSTTGTTYSMFTKDGSKTSAIIMTFANPTDAKKAILALCRSSM